MRSATSQPPHCLYNWIGWYSLSFYGGKVSITAVRRSKLDWHETSVAELSAYASFQRATSAHGMFAIPRRCSPRATHYKPPARQNSSEESSEEGGKTSLTMNSQSRRSSGYCKAKNGASCIGLESCFRQMNYGYHLLKPQVVLMVRKIGG